MIGSPYRALVELTKLEPHEAATLIPRTPSLVTYRGSIAHGTHIPPENDGIDDVDLIGCYVPDLSHYFRYRQTESGHDKKLGPWDMASYELTHFIHLLLAANPNIVASLWCRPEHIIVCDEVGHMLLAERRIFLSKRLYHTFVGYAHAQLKRMTAWKDSGEDRCCVGEEFHTEDCPLKTQNGRGSQKKFATGYMGQKRKSLVEKFGYDVKNAAHLIRLLRMGKEALTEGVLHVDRTHIDAADLMAIKRGERTLDAIQAESNALFEELRTARDASTLPERPNEERAWQLACEALCIRYAGDATLVANRLKLARMA